MAEPICLQVPICLFDAKNEVLRLQCEAKLQTVQPTDADIDASIKNLSINAVWAQDVIQKVKVPLSGKCTPRFPTNIDSVANIVKQLHQLDIIIEFEDGNR